MVNLEKSFVILRFVLDTTLLQDSQHHRDQVDVCWEMVSSTVSPSSWCFIQLCYLHMFHVTININMELDKQTNKSGLMFPDDIHVINPKLSILNGSRY